MSKVEKLCRTLRQTFSLGLLASWIRGLRFEYVYAIKYENDFSILVYRPYIVTSSHQLSSKERHRFETCSKDPSCLISAHMAAQNDQNESVLFSLLTLPYCTLLVVK